MYFTKVLLIISSSKLILFYYFPYHKDLNINFLHINLTQIQKLFKIFFSPNIVTPFFSTISSTFVYAAFPPCDAAKS